MLGRSHGLSGAAAGLGWGAATGASPVECLILGGISMLAAYVPDIDHRGSTVSRVVPLLGGFVSWVVRGASRAVYTATKGPRDEDHSGEHRHFSHTLVFAVGLGFLVWLAVSRFAGEGLGVVFGVGVALGCFVHCLGDALTVSGCPFLWPVPIRGETFYELGPPRFLRFRTGGWVESAVVDPLLTVALVLLLPGVWPLVSPLVLDLATTALEMNWR